MAHVFHQMRRIVPYILSNPAMELPRKDWVSNMPFRSNKLSTQRVTPLCTSGGCSKARRIMT